MPIVDRRPAHRVEAPTSQMPQRHRLVEGTGGCRAGRGNGVAVEFGQDPHRVHVGQLALARPHPHGAVALEQFDAVVAFLMRIDEIRQVQILVEIHEVLLARMGENRIAVAESFSPRRRGCRHFAVAVTSVVRGPQPGDPPVFPLCV